MALTKKDIAVGRHYSAKVGANVTTVRVDEVREVEGRSSGASYWAKTSPASTRYEVTNIRTGKRTTFRSAQKFRSARPSLDRLTAVEVKAIIDGEAGRRSAHANGTFLTEFSDEPVPRTGLTTPTNVVTDIPDGSTEDREIAVETTREEREEVLAPELAAERSKLEEAAQPDAVLPIPSVTPALYGRAVELTHGIRPGSPQSQLTVEQAEALERSRLQHAVAGAEIVRPFVHAAAALPSPAATIGTPAVSVSPIAGRLAASVSTARHVQVQALAGTGKTTTMVEGMRLLKGQTPSIDPSPQQRAVWDQMGLGKSDTIRFAAFGKAIATKLQDRLARTGLDRQGCEASTFHSMGYKAVMAAFGRQKPNQWTVLDLVADAMGKDFRDIKRDPKQLRIAKAVDELVGLCKQNLSEADPESLDELTSHYDVDTDKVRDQVFALVPTVLEACKQPKGRITFDDMVWLPVVHGLPLAKVDVMLVDEVQDLNRMQQALAYQAAHRIIMVGDENQAIFGFAGADAQSMDRMQKRLDALTLPLTVTRRCSRAVVREAQAYVPAFEAHASNGEGAVGTASFTTRGKDAAADDYFYRAGPGDFVLCRTNAPLVQQCFRFLKAGRKANIQGRDVGRGLISTIEKLRAETVPDLVGKLTDWLTREVAKESAKRMPSESKIEQLQDRVDCLVCFTDNASTVADVTRKIQDVFTDDKLSPGIKLSSIHRSKGLEADQVFILHPKGGMREDKMQAWERQQEANLRYVAITRAKNELVRVYQDQD